MNPRWNAILWQKDGHIGAGRYGKAQNRLRSLAVDFDGRVYFPVYAGQVALPHLVAGQPVVADAASQELFIEVVCLKDAEGANPPLWHCGLLAGRPPSVAIARQASYTWGNSASREIGPADRARQNAILAHQEVAVMARRVCLMAFSMFMVWCCAVLWVRGSDPDTGKKMLTNSIGMKLKLIPAGEFQMGSPVGEAERQDDEYQHRVRITKPFYLGVYEVTVGQFGKSVSDSGYKTDAERNKDFEGAWGFNAATGKFERNKGYSWRQVGFPQGDDHPVVNVSHNDAVAFCVWLSRKEGQTYRLPTEAEWEYASRAGTTTRYYHGDDPEGLSEVGNVADGTAKSKFSDWPTIAGRDGCVFTAPVGKYKANGFGLYDMHGNVWEWCADWYDGTYYEASPVDDPTGPTGGSFRVFRGGGWDGDARDCRAANRCGNDPSGRGNALGFRLARTVSSPSPSR